MTVPASRIKAILGDIRNNIIRRKWSKAVTMTMVYALLLIFGFVFVYPLVYMLLRSFMPPEDVFNPTVNFVPSLFTLENYRLIFSKMNLWKSLGYSLTLSGICSLLQALSCGLMGFAMSRFKFKMKPVYLVLVLVCFIVPSQVTMIPTYLGFSNLKLLGSPMAFFIPAILGQGFKAPIFILIFYSFFNTIPTALDEAAQIDGAPPLLIFFRILVPLAMPAIVLTIIFSMVWYWNETYLTAIYIGDSAKTLLREISAILSLMENEALRDPIAGKINVPVKMAASFICVAPLLVFYLVMQKQFVESIDKSGITGE